MHSRRRFVICVTAALMAVGGVASSACWAEGRWLSSWPQWRGPTRDAQVTAPSWPNSLADPSLERSWSVPLGPSYSGPIVSRDLVFVTETQGREEEVVRALDRASGEQVWAARWQGAIQVPFFASANGSWIRSTPACDGERLYVAGMRDVLVCLDAATGEQVWRVDFAERLQSPRPKFGCVTSPLVAGDYVYLQAGAGVLKLDKRTGNVLWHTLRDSGGMSGGAFSSPTLTRLAGAEQLLVQTRSKLAGVDPSDGRVLWSQEVPAFRGMNILTPTVYRDSVLTSSYGGGTFCFQLTANDHRFDVRQAWNSKVQGYMSSPVIVDGHAYLHLRNQRLTCLDLATGGIAWTSRPFGKYWSMVANGEQLLTLDASGDLRLIRANPRGFELLAERKVSDDSWAHLAVCDDQVFIRELDAMTVYRWRASNEPLAAATLNQRRRTDDD